MEELCDGELIESKWHKIYGSDGSFKKIKISKRDFVEELFLIRFSFEI